MFKDTMKFHSPTTVEIENGASKKLGNYLEKMGVHKALIITDSILVELKVVDQIVSEAAKSGVEFEIYQGVLPEPPLDNVTEALRLYQETGCDGVVGLGGGSPMDVAKAVAMLATNTGEFMEFTGIGNVPHKCAPLVTIPTTSGTGSEVSVFSIIIVNESKTSIVDANVTANVALVDPLLTVSVPKKVTAATGIDAFCHHLESFLSVNASPLSDALALEGLRIISNSLRKAVGHGENLEARLNMSYASTLGGFNMNLTDGAAANHGLAFALGARFHVGHGLANAVLLPYVFPVIAKTELEKVKLIGQAMGEKLEDKSDREVVQSVTKAITSLVKDVDCLVPLSEFGVKEDDLDDLVVEAETQKRVIEHSTYKMNSEEIKAIFATAL